MNTQAMIVSNRKIHNVVQGSPEWEELREQGYYTASEAPMAAGVHKNVKRSEAIRLRATGDKKAYNQWITDVLFARGHEHEAAARSMAESIIEDELFPVTMTAVVNGLPLLASLDGRTMGGRYLYEHKTWNEELAAQVRAGTLDKQYTIQLDQQLIVSGAEAVLFMVSDGTPDRCVWRWYSTPVDVAGLVAIWRQYEKDIADYQHVEEPTPVVGELVTDLPAVSVQVSGDIAIRSNFAAYRVDLENFLANQLIRDPQTDQDFANLDLQIKVLKKAEDQLNAAEASIIAQVASIDEQKRMKDALYKLTRDNRLMAEKLVEAKKSELRSAILQRGKDDLAKHINGLNQTIGMPYMPPINADFAGAMKGKKTVASLKDAVGAELARAKIVAESTAALIILNLKALRDHASEYKALFADTANLVLKPQDDLLAVIKARIGEHKEAEQQRLDREREKIREEERRRADEHERIRAQAEAQAKAREEERQRLDAKAMKAAEERGAQQAILAHAEKRAGISITHPKEAASISEECAQNPTEENRLIRSLTTKEKAVLSKPYPGDFGIPKEHWEAARAYAICYCNNFLIVNGIEIPNT